MRTMITLAAVAALMTTSPGQQTWGTVTVEVDDFDGPYVDIAQGFADSGIDAANNHKWRRIGFGPPSYYESNVSNTPPGIPNQGTDNQVFVLAPGDKVPPGSPYPLDPMGTGILANMKVEGTSESFNTIDWVAFVQAHGGPAPDLTKPAVFTADCQIAADNLDHFYQLELTLDIVLDGSTTKTVTRFTAKDRDGNLNPQFQNAVWFDDVELVSYPAFPTVASMPIFLFDFNFDVVPDGVPASGVKFHIDDLKITYTPVCSTPPQDADRDGDVDLADFGVFQACFNGPNRPWPDGPDADVCRCLDADPAGGDGDVDLADFGMFQACFNGPNRPPAPGC